jgi:hypothetical protein
MFGDSFDEVEDSVGSLKRATGALVKRWCFSRE